MVVTPIYVASIPIAVYGAWLASGDILSWATILDPGFSTIVQQRVGSAYGANDRAKLGEVALGGAIMNLAVATAVGVLAGVVVLLLPVMLPRLTPDELAPVQSACAVAAVGVFLTIACYVLTAICMGLQSSWFVYSSMTAGLVISLIVQAVLVARGWGPVGIASGSIVRGALLAIASSLYIWRRFSQESIPFRTSLAAVREIGGLVSYTFVARLFMTLAGNVDSFLVARLIGPETAAMMRITRASVDICTNLTNRPAAAVAPVVSHLAGSGLIVQRRDHLLRLIRLAIWVSMLSMSGLVVLNRAFVTLWVGEKLYAGFPVTLTLSIGLVAGSAAAILGHLISAMGFIRAGSLIGTGQAAITILATAAGGCTLGLVGIAAGAGIGTCFTALCCLRLLYREGFVDQRDLICFAKELGAGGLSACGVAIFFSQVTEATTWPVFIAHAVATGTAFCLLMLTLSRDARREFANCLRSFQSRLL